MWRGADAGGERAQVGRSDLSSPPYSHVRSEISVDGAFGFYRVLVGLETHVKERRATPLIHLDLDSAWELGKIVKE